MRRFRLLTDSRIEPRAVAGTIVAKARHYDYGVSSDDTRITGIPHMSVTLDENGEYPFFTHAEPEMEELAASEARP